MCMRMQKDPICMLKIQWSMSVDYGNAEITQHALKGSVFTMLKLDTIQKKKNADSYYEQNFQVACSHVTGNELQSNEANHIYFVVVTCYGACTTFCRTVRPTRTREGKPGLLTQR